MSDSGLASAQALARSVPEGLRPQVIELAENVIFMRRKLAAARKGLAEQDIVVPYDNGGGQVGIRRNPAFDAYEALLRSYQSALADLRSLLDVPKADEGQGGGATKRMQGKFRSFSGSKPA